MKKTETEALEELKHLKISVVRQAVKHRKLTVPSLITLLNNNGYKITMRTYQNILAGVLKAGTTVENCSKILDVLNKPGKK